MLESAVESSSLGSPGKLTLRERPRVKAGLLESVLRAARTHEWRVSQLKQIFRIKDVYMTQESYRRKLLLYARQNC